MKNNIHIHPTKHLFVHVPKNAGRSIFVMLNNGRTGLRGSHAPVQKYKDYLGDDFKNYFSFAFVRNPWDRMVSLFHYSKETFLADKYKREVDFSTFGKFLRTARKGGTFFKIHMKTQSQYICINGKIAVNYVGRFETLKNDIETIFKRIGLPIANLTHEHKTTRKPYTDYYDDSLKCIVDQLFGDDIKRFGYSYA